MLLFLKDYFKIHNGFAPEIFLDIQFHINNGTYSWRNGPEIKLTEWLFTGIASPNHPYVPKWIYLRSLFVKFSPFYVFVWPTRVNGLWSETIAYSLYSIALSRLAIANIKQILKKQPNRQNRFYELRYRTSKTYGLLLFRISVRFWNKLLIGVASKHFRMFWTKFLLRVRSEKFWKWIFDPVRA